MILTGSPRPGYDMEKLKDCRQVCPMSHQDRPDDQSKFMKPGT